MEFASFLAGEKWSDHPQCTHSLLAALARDVNDHVGDDARNGLVPLVPEVIGLNGTEPRVHAWIALEAAHAALPVVSEERQGIAALALLRCERALNDLDGRPRHHVSQRTVDALAGVPRARDWARDFSAVSWGHQGTFARRSAPAIVHSSVCGIAMSTDPDPDRVLVDLLHRTVGLCKVWFAEPEHVVDAPERIQH
jgi:hypothetical protein